MSWTEKLKFPAAIALLCCAIPVLRAHEQSWYQVHPSPAATPSATAYAGPSAAQNEPFVLLDPSHGGDDKGAVLGSHLLEKDLTLAFAREVRKQLLDRGIACRLLREGDVAISLERRAEAANDPHVALYVALHAARRIQRMRIYTPVLSSRARETGSFLSWSGAQQVSLKRSEGIAQQVARELGKANLSASVQAAPLRPLNNIVAPALAVEISPEQGGSGGLSNSGPERTPASALAAAIASSRNQWSLRQ
jgi:N-acetylmuramoyl-L-alanine amidase